MAIEKPLIQPYKNGDGPCFFVCLPEAKEKSEEHTEPKSGELKMGCHICFNFNFCALHRFQKKCG
jgi:hypothetical protein